MKYHYLVEGLRRNNVGDVLQGMVARQFLPATATAADREAMKSLPADEPAVLVANGWYLHNRASFPPPDCVTPIYVSVHIDHPALLRREAAREHFRRHAPIGCRDRKTLWLLRGWGIPAYYSSCLTLTARELVPQAVEPSGELLLVDGVDHPVPEPILRRLEAQFGGRFTRISHDPPETGGDFQEYSARTEAHVARLLTRYKAARLIVTTKIHCALPSLSLGAPVMLVHPTPQDRRLDPVRELLRIWSFAELLAAPQIELPTVDAAKLEARRTRVRKIVRESVAAGGNVVRRSSAPEFRRLRAEAVLMAGLARAAVRLARRLPLLGKRLSRHF